MKSLCLIFGSLVLPFHRAVIVGAEEEAVEYGADVVRRREFCMVMPVRIFYSYWLTRPSSVLPNALSRGDPEL